MVLIGSREDANTKCAGSQTLIHSVCVGKEESIEIGTCYKNGLDEIE